MLEIKLECIKKTKFSFYKRKPLVIDEGQIVLAKLSELGVKFLIKKEWFLYYSIADIHKTFKVAGQ